MSSKVWFSAAIAVAAVACSGAARSAEALAAGSADVAPVGRILYSSDWSGSGQIYAVDPAQPRSPGQVTFGRSPVCPKDVACGFDNAIPSPDGTRLLFTDFVQLGTLHWNLFVARADGSARRMLAKLRTRYGVPFAAWSPDSRRVVYAGADGIHAVRGDGRKDRRVRTSRPEDYWPAWSPDGRGVTFVDPGSGDAGDLVLVRDGRRRTVTRRAVNIEYAWSPDGKWIAVSASGRHPWLALEASQGSGHRDVVANGRAGELAWSPDSRYLAFVDRDGLKVADSATYVVRRLADGFAYDVSWSPDGRRLAYLSAGSVTVLDARTGRARRLSPEGASSPSWAPDGRSIAYVARGGFVVTDRFVGALRVAMLDGRTRTVVDATDRYGGSIGRPVWTTPAAGTRYRPPVGRELAILDAASLQAPWPIDRIATDGDRVAYSACGHAFVWDPSRREVIQAEASSSLSPACPSPAYYTSYHVYGLALAGDRVVSGAVLGGMGRVWSLTSTTTSGRRRTVVLGDGHATGGSPAYGDVVGEPHGSGDLVFFSSWREVFAPPPDTNIRGVTTRQEIRHAPLGGCPCPVIGSSPGPLVPLDVQGGRVVAAGDNETWVLDAAGTRLLALPISPVAAQLSGNDLVLVRRGELRHNDAATGTLLNTWPLPDVTTGRECASPNPGRCPYSQPARLVLQDAARGLAAYVLDGRVRLLRLSDGVDVLVARGTLARFMDAGLVYVDGSMLHLVPFDRLPLR